MSWKVIEHSFTLLAKAVSGPTQLVSLISVATVSVTQCLLTLRTAGVVEDLGKLKKTLFLRIESDTRKTLAEAAGEVNKSNLLKRNDRISKAEERLMLAEAAKADAEAKARLIEADAERVRQISEATARVIKALTEYRGAGGILAVNEENLTTLLGLDYRPPK